MSGAQGYPVTIAGTATTTELPVAITSPILRGHPNKDGSRPTPQARSVFLRGETRIHNLDGTNNLLVRINNGAARITLKPNETLSLSKALVFALSVQSSASTVAYDVVGTASI